MWREALQRHLGNTDHVAPLVVLVIASALLGIGMWRVKGGGNSPAPPKQFRAFRFSYLAVFLVMATADWLQGSYLYALYRVYGFGRREIGELFVFGFASSGVFSAIVGPLADAWGRKKMVFVFVIVYSISCFTKHFNDYKILAFGRITGGAGTSILFSVFDAWMVHEHHTRQFDAELLGETFSLATYGNGIAAIVSGLVASAVVQAWGMVAPFDVSIVLLLIGGAMAAYSWNENYGNNAAQTAGASRCSGTLAALRGSITVLTQDSSVIYCGLIQSFFEGAMYAFVLLWTPMLPSIANFGIIFGCFMVAVMIGSQLYQVARRIGVTDTGILIGAFSIATPALLIPAYVDWDAYAIIFTCFLVFELCCGLYFSAFYTLRARIVPDANRATVLNLYRIPLNCIVVIVCLLSGTVASQIIFTICGIFQVLCILLTMLLRHDQASPSLEYEKVHQTDKELPSVSTPSAKETELASTKTFQNMGRKISPEENC